MQYTRTRHVRFRFTKHELRNRDYTNQTKFPFGPDTMTRQRSYCFSAHSISIWPPFPKHFTYNPALFSIVTYVYAFHIRKSRISPQIWCMFPMLCPHRSSNSMYSRVM